MENLKVWLPALSTVMPLLTAVVIWLLSRDKDLVDLEGSKSDALEKLTDTQSKQLAQIQQLSIELMESQGKERKANKEIANLHNIISEQETALGVERRRVNTLQAQLDGRAGTEEVA